MEYSERIDQQIAELLSTRNRVTPAHLPGIPDDEGAALLEHYAGLHGAEQHVRWDGDRLVRERPVAEQAAVPEAGAASGQASRRPAGASGQPKKPSPVDQVLAAPVEKSLLDSAASAPVSPWLWLLPLVLGLPGGLIAWLLVKDTNRGVARAMLVVSVIVTIVSVVAGVSLRGAFERIGTIIQPGG